MVLFINAKCLCVYLWNSSHCFFPCSGGQNITIMGRNFDVIDNLIISHELKGNINVSLQLLCNNSYFQGWFCFHHTQMCWGIFFVSVPLCYHKLLPVAWSIINTICTVMEIIRPQTWSWGFRGVAQREERWYDKTCHLPPVISHLGETVFVNTCENALWVAEVWCKEEHSCEG